MALLRTNIVRENRGLLGGFPEGAGLLECDVMPLGLGFPTFRRNVLPSSSKAEGCKQKYGLEVPRVVPVLKWVVRVSCENG